MSGIQWNKSVDCTIDMSDAPHRQSGQSSEFNCFASPSKGVLRGLAAEEQINSVWQRRARKTYPEVAYVLLIASPRSWIVSLMRLPMRFWRRTGMPAVWFGLHKFRLMERS